MSPQATVGLPYGPHVPKRSATADKNPAASPKRKNTVCNTWSCIRLFLSRRRHRTSPGCLDECRKPDRLPRFSACGMQCAGWLKKCASCFHDLLTFAVEGTLG